MLCSSGSTRPVWPQDWEEGDGDYVAPELLAIGGEPSPAADIFSLGATLYECATGEGAPSACHGGQGKLHAVLLLSLLTPQIVRPLANYRLHGRERPN